APPCGERRAARRAAGRDAGYSCRKCFEVNEMRNRAAQEAADKASTYEWGFTSDIEQEFAPKGLIEDTVRYISARKREPEWMLEWRLKAYRLWLDMRAPNWAKLNVP